MLPDYKNKLNILLLKAKIRQPHKLKIQNTPQNIIYTYGNNKVTICYYLLSFV